MDNNQDKAWKKIFYNQIEAQLIRCNLQWENIMKQRLDTTIKNKIHNTSDKKRREIEDKLINSSYVKDTTLDKILNFFGVKSKRQLYWEKYRNELTDSLECITFDTKTQKILNKLEYHIYKKCLELDVLYNTEITYNRPMDSRIYFTITFTKNNETIKDTYFIEVIDDCILGFKLPSEISDLVNMMLYPIIKYTEQSIEREDKSELEEWLEL